MSHLPLIPRPSPNLPRVISNQTRKSEFMSQSTRMFYLRIFMEEKMRSITLASLAALLLLTLGAWAQTKAQPERITNGPVVKKAAGTVAEIAWSTDAPGSSIVKYGTTPNALSETAEAPWGGTKEPNGDYNHTVWVKNLKPNTDLLLRGRDHPRRRHRDANPKPAEGVSHHGKIKVENFDFVASLGRAGPFRCVQLS